VLKAFLTLILLNRGKNQQRIINWIKNIFKKGKIYVFFIGRKYESSDEDIQLLLTQIGSQ
jgi:hypothetical protein